MASVLVVDDDPTVREVVASYLRAASYVVIEAADGEAALRHVTLDEPDLVVLDLMLPGIDGLEVCRRIRGAGLETLPIIMLTAMGGESDRVLGLQLGADDYVTKPFSPRELTLRVGSIMRRAAAGAHWAGPPRTLRDGDLSLDVAARSAVHRGARLALTLREFDLLVFLVSHPGVAFTREQLLSRVWGWDFGDQSTVTVHVRRLRAKLERDPGRPERLLTVWGIGYSWQAAGR